MILQCLERSCHTKNMFETLYAKSQTNKLNHYVNRGKVNCWINNFLTDISQAVVVEGETSDYVSVESRVPQGSVLCPALFLYYINDMPEDLTSTVRLFADEIIVYLTVISDTDTGKLQTDLDKLGIWEKRWKMEFHPNKCNVLTISRKSNPLHHQYILHGHILETVTRENYLGCFFLKHPA